MANQQDQEIYSGNDIIWECSFLDELTELPMDISGAQKLTYALSKTAKSGAALITKEIGNGVVIVNPANGQAQITLDAADTEPLSGLYYHEIRLVNALGKKLTLMFGAITINTNLIRD